jgi:hypothetical protein
VWPFAIKSLDFPEVKERDYFWGMDVWGWGWVMILKQIFREYVAGCVGAFADGLL